MATAATTSAARLEACLPYIFAGEGGYTNNPKDPGNWTGGKVGKGVLKGTKYGIAANSFPTLDIKNLTKEQAADIYRARYWTTAGCDQLEAGVDLPIFDVSVNSGPGRARQFRDATAAYRVPEVRIKEISKKRRAFYQGLSTFKTFGKGWLARVAKIEAAALRMALAAAGMPTSFVKEKLLAEAKASEGTAQKSAAAGVTATGGGGTVAAASLDWATIGVTVVLVGIAVVVAWHFLRAHSERAKAMQAEAGAL